MLWIAKDVTVEKRLGIARSHPSLMIVEGHVLSLSEWIRRGEMKLENLFVLKAHRFIYSDGENLRLQLIPALLKRSHPYPWLTNISLSLSSFSLCLLFHISIPTIKNRRRKRHVDSCRILLREDLLFFSSVSLEPRSIGENSYKDETKSAVLARVDLLLLFFSLLLRRHLATLILMVL